MTFGTEGQDYNKGNAARDIHGFPRYQVSYQVPALLATVDNAEVAAARRQCADLLAIRASEALARPVSDIVVRDLLPKTDLGFTNEAWLSGSLSSNAYAATAVINQALTVVQLVGFYGFADLSVSPTISLIRFQRGSAEILAICEVESAYAFQFAPVAIIRPTVVYNPADTVNFNVYASATTAQATVLLGFEAEAVGVQVAPPRYNRPIEYAA